eukprot:2233809-Pyramimonas_sp.AAC.1
MWALSSCGVKRGSDGEPASKEARVAESQGGGAGASGSRKDEKSLLEAVARLTLINARDVATLESNVIQTYLIPKDHFLARAGLAAN